MNDCEEDYGDESDRESHPFRDDVAKARAEEMAWYEKFKAYRDASQAPVDGETSTKATTNVWKYEVDWLHVKSNRKGLTATLQEHHR